MRALARRSRHLSRRPPARLLSRRAIAAPLALALAVTLTACTDGADPAGTRPPAATPVVSATPSAPATTPSGEPTPPAEPLLVAEVTSAEDVVTDLAVPWDLVFEDGEVMLVSERNSGRIARVSGGVATYFGGEGARRLQQMLAADGEAGLLGLAVSPTQPDVLYAYITRADGNAVVRMTMGGSGLPLLAAPVDVVAGIPRAANHDGGRIAFGPDGYLYIATGDAARPELAQDRDSEAGKILRVIADGTSADGGAAPGNPFGTRVWSWGHRNVQGLGWTSDGRMYASEFGQSDLDELNLIEPGRNYGWPQVEGTNGAPGSPRPDSDEARALLGQEVDGLTYPVAQWGPWDASPSGIAITDEGIYVGGLRGERVWRVPLVAAGSPDEVGRGTGVGEPHVLLEDLGRIRDIEVGPGGALYVVTGNTDGRGRERIGDDRIVRITVK